MVRAILEGRKTVTRRVVKPQHLRVLNSPYHKAHPDVPDKALIERLCDPPYHAGDILYVRETWRPAEVVYIVCDGGAKFFYCADGFSDASEAQKTGRMKWYPSIHMPKEAARIFLRVTGVRVERLQDCGNMEAKDEGCTCGSQFKRLWDSTIKPTDRERYGWTANPWVWVIDFERCERPEE